MAWASARTCAAWALKLSAVWKLAPARSSNRRMRVKFAPKLSSRLAISVSPVAVEYLLEASDTLDHRSITRCSSA